MKKLILLLAFCGLFATGAHAQTILNSTTLNGAVTRTQQTFTLTSATVNIANGAAAFSPALAVGQEYVIADGGGLEAGIVTAINGVIISVQRNGQGGTRAMAHATGAVIFFGATSSFYNGPPGSGSGTDPGAACTRQTLRILPWIEVAPGPLGLIWSCGSQGSPQTASTWVAAMPYLGQGGTASTGWLR